MLAVLLLGVPPSARAAATDDNPYFIPSSHTLKLGAGAWSYFGDARSVAHGTDVFTGWISPAGDVWIAQTDTDTLKTRKRMIYRDLGTDDHNNPSLVLWRGRLMVFFSEHSGRVLGKNAQMRYRVSRLPFSIAGGFERVRSVPTNTPGGLGYTYPNPIVSGKRLFLFWRGGDWNPTFSVTRDGRRWAKARTLVLGPGTPEAPQRPYSKYAEGPGDAFAMTFSDGHPKHWENSLYFLQYRRGAFYKADGTRIGTLDDVPFRRSEVDTIYKYDPALGRAWPHDIAFGRGGLPVVAYTRRLDGPDGVDDFHYAIWTGSRWSDHEVVSAGAGAMTYTSGGMTLDHADPSNVVLSRTLGPWNQVEIWGTPDFGESWGHATLTAKTDGFSMRPVIPRGFDSAKKRIIVYFDGTTEGFRHFHTHVEMLVYDGT